MKKLLIIGASGHGRVVADIAKRRNEYEQIEFLDDNTELLNKTFAGRNVIGTTEYALQNAADYDVFVAIGNNRIRERVIQKLEYSNASIPVLIHPNAVVSDDVEIDAGTVVMPGAVINSGAKIGKGVIINTSCSVDHDCVIENYVHISVGAHVAGTVRVGKGTWIGAGAVVSNNLSIAADVMLGAGAVAVKDIEIKGTYVGVPAKLK